MKSRSNGSNLERLEPRCLLAANPIISEFSASNGGVLQDGDRDSPDWIEIYNAGDESAELEGWYLTDDENDRTKWQFPATTLEADSYLVIFASGKNTIDRRDNLHTNFRLASNGEYLALVQPDGTTIATELSPEFPRQLTDVSYGIPMGEMETKLVNAELAAQILVPTDDRYGTDWTTPDFQPDANWLTEVGGQAVTAAIGYEDDSGFASHFAVDVESEMKGENASIYMRIPFDVADPSSIEELHLRMKFDDGYIAYLNGTVIDVQNGPFFRSFDSAALSARPNAEAIAPDDVTLAQFINLLVPGENVLGIQGFNVSAADGDFLLAPEIITNSKFIEPDEFGFFVNPTPGAINGNRFTLGPRISDVSQPDGAIASNESIVVTAHVEKTLNDLGTVELVYRSMYEEEVRVPMADDGNASDAIAGDGIYTSVIPAGVSEPGEMIRYYVAATDELENASREPRVTDTSGTDRSPEYFGTIVEDPELTSNLPIFHWFAERTSRARSRSGARVSVYFEGEFYDNVFARQRGGATNGSSQKFNFNDDQPFYVNEVLGRVNEFNMNAQGSDPTYVRQPLAFNTYTWAGHESSESFFMLMRDNATEDRVGVFIEQVDQNFLSRNGLDPDGALYKFVQRSNLDPVFSDVTTGIEKKTRLDEGLEDLQAVVDGLTAPDRADKANSVFDNFNVAQLLNYLALRSITMDTDDVRKNFYGYRDTNGTGQWSIFPWDKDWTFGVIGDGNPHHEHPFFADEAHAKANANQWNRLYDAVFNDPVLSEMYVRRLRTVMDRFLQPPDTNPDDGFFENKVDELHATIADDQRVNVTAVKNFFPDRRNTLYNEHGVDLISDGEINILVPEFTDVQYFVPTNNDLGLTWTGLADPANIASWQTGQTGIGLHSRFSELVRTEVDTTAVCDECSSIFMRIPFEVADASSISQLSLRAKFDDGFIAYVNGTEIARVFDGDPSYDSRPRRSRNNALAVQFEDFVASQHVNLLRDGTNVLAIHAINRTSSSASNDMLMLPVLVDGIVPDEEVVPIPHEQVGEPTIALGQFDHNPSSQNQDEEFIEIKNDNDTAVDISGWKLTGGIEHEFPQGTVIASNNSMYVSPNVQAFLARSESPRGGEGLFVQGNYRGHLSNFGETVELVTPSGRTMSSITTPVAPSDAQQFLRVSEIHYNPAGTSESTEFIELTNVSSGDAATTIDISGVNLTDGPSTPFVVPPETQLAPGEHLVITQDRDIFLAAYPQVAADKVIGDLIGLLSNRGERIKLNDADGSTIVDFSYNDNSLWPQAADGVGASLVVIDPANTPTDEFDKSYRWRNSVEFGGSPGGASAEPIGVVINEVLANTDGAGDVIELHNTTEQAVSIAGWHLSDSSNDLSRFQVPDGFEIAAGGYVVIEGPFANPGQEGFNLNGDEGDEVWLVIPSDDGGVRSFVDDVQFGASRVNEAFGRWPNATGRLAPTGELTPAAANSSPVAPGVFISEVNYNPVPPSADAVLAFPNIDADDLEFVELFNSGIQPVNLGGWTLRGGIDFEFSADAVIEGGQTAVILRFNPDKDTNQQRLEAWKTQYDLSDDIPLFGGYSGNLNNSEQILRLESPGAPVDDIVPDYYVDEVVYDDRSPWPETADGLGDSIHRIAGTFGNDATSWSGAAANPGMYEVADNDLNGDGSVDASDIDFACSSINQNDPSFDLNGDGIVNHQDAWYFVERRLNTAIGDANVDGIFNSSDLVAIFSAGEYEDGIDGNSTWAEGDWNCDGEFDTADLVAAFQREGYVDAAVASPSITAGGRLFAAIDDNRDDQSTEESAQELPTTDDFRDDFQRPNEIEIEVVRSVFDDRFRERSIEVEAVDEAIAEMESI